MLSLLKYPYATLFIFLVVLGTAYWLEYESAAEPVAPTNLVLNPLLEATVDDDTQPQFWQASGYGANDAIFRYPVAGVSDSAAAYVEVVNHKDGDAKWVFNDVAAQSGQQFTFTTHYKSNVITRLMARFNTGPCLLEERDCVFKELATLAPRSEWTKEEVAFTTPPETKSVTVFQVLDRDGWLAIDEVALVPVMAPTELVTHKIPNPNVATTTLLGDLPVNWQTSGYGDNTATYEYITDDGYDDATSVKVTVSDYKDGDAKWAYQMQPIAGGKDYQLSIAYKTNTVPHVVVQFVDGAGKIWYLGLPKPVPEGEEWQRYEQEFSVPVGVIFASAFMFVADNGFVQTDDYQIAPYTHTGFERPIITLTFDDGAERNVETALPILEKHNFKSTQCYMTDPLANETNIKNVQLFNALGHEICAHSVSHPDLTKVAASQLTHELSESQSILAAVTGVPVTNFATPFGAYNPAVVKEIKKYYRLHRTVDEGYNSPDNLDWYHLKVQNMKPQTSLTQFTEWVDKAIADKTWLILVYHRVDDGGLSAYDTYTEDFAAQMEYLASTGVTVLTLAEAATEIVGQTE